MTAQCVLEPVQPCKAALHGRCARGAYFLRRRSPTWPKRRAAKPKRRALSSAGSLAAAGRTAWKARRRGATPELQPASCPPQDGRPGPTPATRSNGVSCLALMWRRPFSATADLARRAARSLTPPCGYLTFDMSGGRQPAKLADGRPLDGGVRRHVPKACAKGKNPTHRYFVLTRHSDFSVTAKTEFAWALAHG